MKWYYLVELVVVASFLAITVIGGCFVIVTQIKKPYVASSKLSPLIIQLFISAEIVVIIGTFFMAALVNDNHLYLHRHVCILNDTLVTVGLSVNATTLLLAALDRLFLIFKPLYYHQLTRKQATIPCIFVSLFVGLLAWSWKLATRFKFSIYLEYVSYLGFCQVNLKHCYYPNTTEPTISPSEENSSVPTTIETTLSDAPSINGFSAESRVRGAESEMSKECYKLISYADLNDIIFGLSVYLPVILTLIIFSASYNQFTKRCAETSNGNRRRSTLFGRQTICESVIFGNKSVWLGGAKGRDNTQRRKSCVETIELKDFRPRVDRSTFKKNSLRATNGGSMNHPSFTVKLDGNETVHDALRDERETQATPRSVSLFQEGPSVSVDMLVENAPKLSRLPSRVIERSMENDDGPNGHDRGEKPKIKRKFLNTITKHQLATTRCFMVTAALTFVLLTAFMAIDLALRKSTGAFEKPWFAGTILLVSISFVDFMVMAVFNSYVRRDVICLFRFCCR